MGIVVASALALTACTGSGGISGGGNADSLDKSVSGSIDGAIETAMQLSGSTEAIVGVWDGGENAYVHGYGNENLDGGSRIRAAQATRPVVCALLLDLVEQGRVTLDREVSKDLTRQSGIEGVTYGQLCDMRSGIADFKGAFADIFANNPTRFWPEQELLAEGLAHSPLPWPGKDFNQSDTNAVLLARALKVRTGQDINDLLEDHVFSRAGMRSSDYDVEAKTLRGTTMTGLTYPSAGGAPVCDAAPVEVPEVSPTMLAGAGATVTTVNDLKKFYDSYLGGEFGGKDNAKLTLEGQLTQNPKRDEQGEPTEEVDPEGRQWAFGSEKVGPLYGNAGGMTGTLTAAYQDPESGYTVIVSLNNSSAGAEFVKNLALQLAAISSEGGVGPALTWTAEQKAEDVAKGAICQPAAEEPAPEG